MVLGTKIGSRLDPDSILTHRIIGDETSWGLIIAPFPRDDDCNDQ